MKRQKRLPIAGKNIENFFSSAENIFLVAKVRTFIEKEKSIWSKFQKFHSISISLTKRYIICQTIKNSLHIKIFNLALLTSSS